MSSRSLKITQCKTMTDNTSEQQCYVNRKIRPALMMMIAFCKLKSSKNDGDLGLASCYFINAGLIFLFT